MFTRNARVNESGNDQDASSNPVSVDPATLASAESHIVAKGWTTYKEDDGKRLKLL